MDEAGFDRLTRLFGTGVSRRSVLRAAGAVAVAAAFGRRVASAATCVIDGGACDPGNADMCCSGRCARKGRRHRCKSAPDAQGCTGQRDICLEEAAPCPDNPHGDCVVLNGGKPFCALGSACFACKTGKDCDRKFQTTGGICVKHCPVCRGHGGAGCVFPQPLT